MIVGADFLFSAHVLKNHVITYSHVMYKYVWDLITTPELERGQVMWACSSVHFSCIW